MIKLDRIGFVIYEFPPIPYELYIKCYGRSNTQQVLVQTNDDALEGETQTEPLVSKTKWTQCPISFNLSATDNLEKLKNECSGVGCEELVDGISADYRRGGTDTNASLYQFVEKYGQIILSLLEEEDQYGGSQSSDQNLNSDIFENNTRDLKFSDQFINMKVDDVTFLKGRHVSHTLFCRESDVKLITVHQKPSTKDSSTTELVNRCMLCQWDITQPSTPLHILVSNSDVTSIVCNDPSLVVAGMRDGSISVWDVRDRTLGVRVGDTSLRPASYNTGEW
uniref:WD repeat-containing protein 60 n=1 Tax=Cacopsylla melanoneura TaxID=428564 RepID=A0A8D8YF95_9HEMI